MVEWLKKNKVIILAILGALGSFLAGTQFDWATPIVEGVEESVEDVTKEEPKVEAEEDAADVEEAEVVEEDAAPTVE